MVTVAGLVRLGSWRDVADAARTTAGRGPGTGEPSASWKRRLLLAEHSPIRLLSFRWRWVGLPSWVSVHLVRHKHGIEHFVRSQRQDRTGIPRSELRQDAPVEHEVCANVQAILTISRKRLCLLAAPETRSAWLHAVRAIGTIEPEVASLCVPECVRCGFCPEMDPCAYVATAAFRDAVAQYRRR